MGLRGSASRPSHRSAIVTCIARDIEIKKLWSYSATFKATCAAGGIWKYWVLKIDDNVSFETRGRRSEGENWKKIALRRFNNCPPRNLNPVPQHGNNKPTQKLKWLLFLLPWLSGLADVWLRSCWNSIYTRTRVYDVNFTINF